MDRQYLWISMSLDKKNGLAMSLDKLNGQAMSLEVKYRICIHCPTFDKNTFILI